VQPYRAVPAACCAASREPSTTAEPEGPVNLAPVILAKEASPTSGLVLLAGGEFLMGTAEPGHYPADGEGPVRRVHLDPFWIDPLAVSNAQFAAFVAASGYQTDAERYGWSFVF